MAWISERIASHGFVVLAVTPNDPLGEPSGWQKAHNDAIDTLKKESQRSESPIYEKVDKDRLGMVGFSRGGGGVSLAAADNVSGIKAAVAMCPWYNIALSNFSSGESYEQAGQIRTPILYFTGTDDIIAMPHGVLVAYNSTPDITPKMFLKYQGLGHLMMYDNGEVSTSPLREKVATMVISFLKVYLEEDNRYATYLNGEKFDESWFADHLSTL